MAGKFHAFYVPDRHHLDLSSSIKLNDLARHRPGNCHYKLFRVWIFMIAALCVVGVFISSLFSNQIARTHDLGWRYDRLLDSSQPPPNP